MDGGRLLGRGGLRRETIAELAAIVLGAAAVILAYGATHGIAQPPEDFGAYRSGAMALRDGISIYTNVTFVYPPPAAVAFLPFAYGNAVAAGQIWLYVEVAALMLACVMAVRPAHPAKRILAAVFVIVMIKSDLFFYSFYLGNMSVLLAPVAVGALLSFERQRWRLGCALIVGSLLLKPLLAPLLLLPLLRGRWRDLLVTGIPGLAVLALAVYTLPGASHFWAVIPRLLGGSNLVHQFSVYNLSLNGLGDRLHATAAFVPLRLIVAFAGLAALVAWTRHGERPGSTAAAGVAVLLTVFLSGSLSENHYLLVVAPALVLALSFARPMAAMTCAVGAFVLVFLPQVFLGNSIGPWDVVQVRFVVAEVLMFAAAVTFIVYPRLRGASDYGLHVLPGAAAGPQADA